MAHKEKTWHSEHRSGMTSKFIILNICDTSFFFSWGCTIHFIPWGTFPWTLTMSTLWSFLLITPISAVTLCFPCCQQNQSHRLTVKGSLGICVPLCSASLSQAFILWVDIIVYILLKGKLEIKWLPGVVLHNFYVGEVGCKSTVLEFKSSTLLFLGGHLSEKQSP